MTTKKKFSNPREAAHRPTPIATTTEAAASAEAVSALLASLTTALDQGPAAWRRASLATIGAERQGLDRTALRSAARRWSGYHAMTIAVVTDGGVR